MRINPLEVLASLYSNEAAPAKPISIAEKVSNFNEEATFFARLFRVRPEEMAPFLSIRVFQDLKKKRKKKMRRVNKKTRCSSVGLRKKQLDSDDIENQYHDFA